MRYFIQLLMENICVFEEPSRLETKCTLGRDPKLLAYGELVSTWYTSELRNATRTFQLAFDYFTVWCLDLFANDCGLEVTFKWRLNSQQPLLILRVFTNQLILDYLLSLRPEYEIFCLLHDVLGKVWRDELDQGWIILYKHSLMVVEYTVFMRVNILSRIDSSKWIQYIFAHEFCSSLKVLCC